MHPARADSGAGGRIPIGPVRGLRRTSPRGRFEGEGAAEETSTRGRFRDSGGGIRKGRVRGRGELLKRHPHGARAEKGRYGETCSSLSARPCRRANEDPTSADFGENNYTNHDRREPDTKAPANACSVLWCGEVLCGVVWCGVVWCGVMWSGVVWWDVVGCDAMRHGGARRGEVCCDAMWHEVA